MTIYSKPTSTRIHWSLPLIIGFIAGSLLLLSVFGANSGDYSFISAVPVQDSSELLKKEILRYVENKYAEETDIELLKTMSIDSLLQYLDPHSQFIPKEEFEQVVDQMHGKFEGIGIEFIELGDTFGVTKILDNSPAQLAGLKVGDLILGINDTLFRDADWDTEARMSRFRGEAKSEISLILGTDNGSSRKMKINRGTVVVQSVPVFYLIDSATAFIRIDKFSNTTYNEFMQAIESLSNDKSVKNIILDLRSNPGGYLQQAVNILSQLFSEKGKLLVSTEGRNSKKTEYKSTGKSFYPIEEIAVLVDEFSASASEIVAGTLQDLDRGIIIGQRTFGKGMVQEQFQLEDGSGLRLTIAYYNLPSGRIIHDLSKGRSGLIRSGSRFDQTIEFKTRKGRIVYQGAGVHPDYGTTGFSFWKDSSEMPVFYAMQKSSFRYYINHPEGLRGKSADDMKLIGAELAEQFMTEFKSAFARAWTPAEKTQVELWLLANIIGFEKGEAEKYLFLNQQDEAVVLALQKIYETDPLALKSIR